MKLHKILVFSLPILLCIASMRFVFQPAQAAIIFEDEFESGDLSAWTGNYTSTGCSIEVSGGYAKFGSYGARFTTAAIASGTNRAYIYKTVNSSNFYYARAYVYFAPGALPLEDNDDRFSFIQFAAGSQALGTAQVRRVSGEDRFTVTTYGATVSTTSVYPQVGQWYCIEFYVKFDSVNGEVRLWIDGVERITYTGYNNSGYGTSITKVNFGNPATINVQHDVTVWVDACAIGDSYIGPYEASPPPFQGLWSDGFESGDFSKWTATYRTTGEQTLVDGVDKHHGNYAARFVCDGSATGEYAYAAKRLNMTYSSLYVRAYYKITAFPTNGTGRFVMSPNLRNGAQGKAVCYVYLSRAADGNVYWGLYYMSGASGLYYTSKVAALPNVWYSIEIYVKVHGTEGAYKVYINGEDIISLSGLDTDEWGGVDVIHIGERWVDSSITPFAHEIHVDCVAIDEKYIGPEEVVQPSGKWAIIFETDTAGKAKWLEWMFGNQSIQYSTLYHYEVTDYNVIQGFGGLIVFTNGGYSVTYNATAIKRFAATRPVIINILDFVRRFYVTSSSNYPTYSTQTVTYAVDFGIFKAGDIVPFNDWVDVKTAKTLYMCKWTGYLSTFGNVTNIAYAATDYSHFFHMVGSAGGYSGFWALDLNAMAPETEWAPIFHLFPIVESVQGCDIKPGKYGKWLANGVSHKTLDQVMQWCRDYVASCPAGMNASWRKVGTSVQGRDINATFIGKGSRYILFESCIHGNEKIPVLATLRLLELIKESFEAGGYWYDRLQEVTLIIIPVLNPDGYVAGTRENANGKDLNRQFPPGETTTEPEAWTVRYLLGNYTPILFIDNHEGRYWDINEYIYGQYLKDNYPVDYKAFTVQNLQYAKAKFEYLKHWGYYTDNNNTFDIGKVRAIFATGITSGAIAYASTLNISSLLFECFCWSGDYGTRQLLYCLDYYLSAWHTLEQWDLLNVPGEGLFLITTNAAVKSAKWTYRLEIAIDNSELVASKTEVKIDVTTKGKPLYVWINGQQKSEGQGWSYADGIVTVSGEGVTSVALSWEEAPPPPGPGQLYPPYTTEVLVAFGVGVGGTLAIWGYRKQQKAKKVKVE